VIGVDASVAAKWIFTEQYSEQARALLRAALSAGERIVAPPLLPIEVTNIIRQRMRQEGLPLPERMAPSPRSGCATRPAAGSLSQEPTGWTSSCCPCCATPVGSGRSCRTSSRWVCLASSRWVILPTALEERIIQADPEALDALLIRAARATHLETL
jgi:hypothetical protein